MRRIVLVLLSVCFGAAVSIGAEQEASVFESQGCGICHKPEASGASPSLKEIAQAYQGKEDHLIGFFKGEAEAIVRPAKANMMKGFIEKTKALSDEDRKTLAGFIMSHSK